MTLVSLLLVLRQSKDSPVSYKVFSLGDLKFVKLDPLTGVMKKRFGQNKTDPLVTLFESIRSKCVPSSNFRCLTLFFSSKDLQLLLIFILAYGLNVTPFSRSEFSVCFSPVPSKFSTPIHSHKSRSCLDGRVDSVGVS